MKRTLKRESKVLEIVRREAIGAGGSSFYNPGLFSGRPLPGGPAGSRGALHRAPVPCPSPGASRAFSPGDEPASASPVADGWLGIINGVRRASLAAVSRRRHPAMPAIGWGRGRIVNPCPRGRGQLRRCGGCACGDREPMPARLVIRRLSARAHLRWVSDAGGTVLIDPSWNTDQGV